MAYTWITGEVITADKLNATEDNGLFRVISTYSEEQDGFVSDKSLSEISAALNAGKVPVLMMIDGTNISDIYYFESVTNDEFGRLEEARFSKQYLSQTSNDYVITGNVFSVKEDKSVTQEHIDIYIPKQGAF